MRLRHGGYAGAGAGAVAVAVAADGHEGLRGHVIDQGATLDGEAVEVHEALADLGVRGWVDVAAFRVTEKVIQGVEAALARVVVGVVAHVGGVLVDGVVDGTVALRLLGLVVPVVPAVVRLPIVSIGLVHLRVGVVIVTRWAGCYVHVRNRKKADG